ALPPPVYLLLLPFTRFSPAWVKTSASKVTNYSHHLLIYSRWFFLCSTTYQQRLINTAARDARPYNDKCNNHKTRGLAYCWTARPAVPRRSLISVILTR